MKDQQDKNFSFQRGEGPGHGPHDYKVTWNTGKKTFTYESENGRYRYSAQKNPAPPRGHASYRHPAEEPHPARRPAPQPPAKKQVRRKSVIPLACVAAIWIGRALTGGLDSVGSILSCAVISAVALGVLRLFFPDRMVDAPEEKPEAAAQPRTVKTEKTPKAKKEEKQPEPEKAPDTGSELDEVLRQGEVSIAEIQRLNDEIPDFKISAQLKQLEILTGRIFDFVRQHPEDVRQIRQFLNYYLPTTIKLLRQYVVLQNQGMRMGNIDEGMKKIEDMLDKVVVAFQQQLDSLFESDVVDITADIQVMEQMMAAEGLGVEKIEVN